MYWLAPVKETEPDWWLIDWLINTQGCLHTKLPLQLSGGDNGGRETHVTALRCVAEKLTEKATIFRTYHPVFLSCDRLSGVLWPVWHTCHLLCSASYTTVRACVVARWDRAKLSEQMTPRQTFVCIFEGKTVVHSCLLLSILLASGVQFCLRQWSFDHIFIAEWCGRCQWLLQQWSVSFVAL